jgi:hypothetical protein
LVFQAAGNYPGSKAASTAFRNSGKGFPATFPYRNRKLGFWKQTGSPQSVNLFYAFGAFSSIHFSASADALGVIATAWGKTLS